MSTDERSKVSFSTPVSTTMSSKISKASVYYDSTSNRWANHTYSPPSSPSQQLTQRRRSSSGDGSDSPLSPPPSSPRPPPHDPRLPMLDINGAKQGATGNPNTLAKGGDGAINRNANPRNESMKSGGLDLPSYQPMESRRNGQKGSSSPLDIWKPLNKGMYS